MFHLHIMNKVKNKISSLAFILLAFTNYCPLKASWEIVSLNSNKIFLFFCNLYISDYIKIVNNQLFYHKIWTKSHYHGSSLYNNRCKKPFNIIKYYGQKANKLDVRKASWGMMAVVGECEHNNCLEN